MAATNLSFRAPNGLMDKLRARDPKGVKYPGSVAKRDVERWYELLANGLRKVRLDAAETVVLVYYVSTFDGEATLQGVRWSGVHLEGRQIGLSASFDSARDSLAEKLATAPLEAAWALWDAAERYQVLASRSDWDELTFGMALHEIGLHPYDFSARVLEQIEKMAAKVADELPGEYLRTLKDADA